MQDRLDSPSADRLFEAGKFKEAFDVQQKSVESNPEKADNWFNLGFYACFTGQPEIAVQAANKTLELNPQALSVETNLALGYVLADHWSEAEKVYRKWKGKFFPDTGNPANDVFLQDITDLEAAGIHHPDFVKVRKLLRE